MNFFRDKIKVVTHNGSFHADEVFACATLAISAEMQNKQLEIIRTRDEKEIAKADIVVDVGMEYDPERGRFDHHQKGGAGEHANGIPHASFGLVWKYHGELVCESKEIADMIEQKLVIPVDARDNGVNISKVLRDDVPEYTIMKELVRAFRPTWMEEERSDEKFFEFLDVATLILKNEIRVCRGAIEGGKLVSVEIKRQNQPEILILEQDIPWEAEVAKFPNIKAVVYRESDRTAWCAETTMDNLYDYNSHKALFREEWRGLRGEELVQVSSFEDAVFCHRAGFFVVAKTKETAIKMAKMALQIG